jgi:hypothetical protein
LSDRRRNRIAHFARADVFAYNSLRPYEFIPAEKGPRVAIIEESSEGIGAVGSPSRPVNRASYAPSTLHRAKVAFGKFLHQRKLRIGNMPVSAT